MSLKINNRKQVFDTVRKISTKELGALVQNEMIVTAEDILLEFINVDNVINKLQEYKKLLTYNVSELTT